MKFVYSMALAAGFLLCRTSGAAESSTAGLQKFISAGQVKSVSGNYTVTQADGLECIQLSAIADTLPQKSKYLYFNITFEPPVNITGKALNISAAASGDATEAFYVRCYNAGEKKPCWSFFNWNKPLKSRFKNFILQQGKGEGLEWEPAVTQDQPADKLNRIELIIGTKTPGVKYDLLLHSLSVEQERKMPDPLEKSVRGNRIYPPPQWSDKPSEVKHPSAIFKQEDIDRGQTNLKHYTWAQEQLAMLRKNSEFWMNMPDKDIALWIPEDDAWFKCLCPNCFTQPEYAWRSLTSDGKLICANCKQVFPSEKFPENQSYTVTTPHGKTRTIKYYKGPDQMTHEENMGPKYHISGELNYMRLRNIGKSYAMACVYALTGEKAYAEKVRRILLRFAEVYPDYMVKFRATTYSSPEENYMAGKFCDWKYHDSYTIINLASAYDLTCSSGLYSDADKLKIENGIFREYKWLVTAHPPTRDWCLNAVPAHMSAGAVSGVMLGDHDLINWTLNGEHGLKAFTEKYYHRDGNWYENSPSYASMANTPLCQLADILQNYSDAPSFKGKDRYDQLNIFAEIPRLGLIFSCMVPAVMPNGRLPAVNDSCYDCRLPLQWLQFLYSHTKSPEHLAMLQYAAQSAVTNPWNVYALFKNPPESGVATLPENIKSSVILSGPQWAILRRPETAADSAALLDFGGPGKGSLASGHYHNSTLNLIYYDWKSELLTDMGYLAWQHPLRPWLISPLAHNLVIVDGIPQDKARNGEAVFWSGNGRVCAVTASAPGCYPGRTNIYRRTVLNIALPGGRQYLADFFRIKGGKKHLYAFHAGGEQFTAPREIEFKPVPAQTVGDEQTGSGWLKNTRAGKCDPGTLRFCWKNADGITTVMNWINRAGQQIIIADAPGLRDVNKPFEKTRLNLLLVQADGPENTFTGIIEGVKGETLISEVKQLTAEPAGTAAAVAVKHSAGIDIIVAAQGQQGEISLKEYPQFKLNGQYGVVRISGGQPDFMWMGEAGILQWGKYKLNGIPFISGHITAIDPAARRLTIDPGLPAGFVSSGLYLLTSGKDADTCRISRADGNQLQLDSGGTITLKPGDQFTIPLYYERRDFTEPGQ